MNNEKVTHISYQTAKALKEFCPKLPEPMDKAYWSNDGNALLRTAPFSYDTKLGMGYPAFQLHDLLSKPFCEAFVKSGRIKFGFDEDEVTDLIADWSTEIAYAYWNGGLPAVEACLMEMIGGK